MKLRFAALGAAVLALAAGSAAAESLRDIYELALENDAQLKAEQAQFMALRETENSNRAALLPQVTANYDINDNDRTTEQESFGVVDGVIRPINTLTNTQTRTDGYTVSLQQAIFDLPAWFTFQSGREISKQAEATFAGNQQNLIVRVVEGYLAVLRAQDNLTASQAAERAFERQLEQSQQRFDVGLIAITDVYEAQAAYDLARATRILDENNVNVALQNLSVITDKEHDSLSVLAEDFEIKKPEPLDRSAWVDFALENNFSLKAAQFAEEAARQAARAAQMAHAPTVRGNASYSETDTTGSLRRVPATPFDAAPDSDTEVTAWAIQVQLPLFSGGAISANRRRAAQDFIAAREQRINLTRSTMTNARALHMTVLNDVAQVAARRQGVISSKSALDATQAGYEVGTRNVVDVLNAQNALFAAQRDYANSRYDYILNMLRLKEQAGLLSPEDVYRLDSFLEEPPPPTASGREEEDGAAS